MKKRIYLHFGIAFLLPLLFIFSQCLYKDKPADPRGSNYAGSASCIKCHRDVYENYLHDPHYKTSRLASSNTVHGSFNPGLNTVAFNDSVKVMMEKHHNDLYQALYINSVLTKKERFDIVFGSNRGETYLYWKDKELYELPITYFLSIHQWANSPGYNGNFVDFNRVMGRHCFECHSSYIQDIPHTASFMDNTEWLDKNSMVLSIDCERCHGPASEHVNYHTQNPDDKNPMYISTIGSLSRAQRIDVCAQCHSGNKSVLTRSIFGFKPGDTLANFKEGEYFHKKTDLASIDVHGNQAELLTSSQCFIKGKIECGTCHNIHNDKVETISMYSLHCTSCHSEAKHNFCKMASQLGPAINSNCIDCHMPVKTSNVIVINEKGLPTNPPFMARIHRIAIYPSESKKIMAWLKTSPVSAKN